MFLMPGSHPKESHRDVTEIRTEAEQTGVGGVGEGRRGVAQSTCSLSGLSIPGGDCVGGGTLSLPFRGFLRGSPAMEAGDTPKVSPEGQWPGQPLWVFCSISK